MVVVIQAVKNAIYESASIPNPPGWATVLVVGLIGAGLAYAEHVSLSVDGNTGMLADQWWVQAMISTGFMIMAYGALKATFGKVVTPVTPPAPVGSTSREG